MSIEKQGVLPDEGEAPKADKKAEDAKSSCGCKSHNPRTQQGCGDDTLSKMAEAAKEAAPPK